jgi:hypothetical protein
MGPVNGRIKVRRRERITSFSDHKEQQCEDVVWIDLKTKYFQFFFVIFHGSVEFLFTGIRFINIGVQHCHR